MILRYVLFMPKETANPFARIDRKMPIDSVISGSCPCSIGDSKGETMRQPFDGRLRYWFANCLLGASFLIAPLSAPLLALEIGSAPKVPAGPPTHHDLRKAAWLQKNGDPDLRRGAQDSPLARNQLRRDSFSITDQKPTASDDKGGTTPSTKKTSRTAESIDSAFFRPFDRENRAQRIDEIIPLERIRLVQAGAEQPYDSPRLNFGGLSGGAGESDLASAPLYQSVGGGGGEDSLSSSLRAISEIASSGAGQSAGAKDAVGVIEASNTVQTVSVQRRSPISLAPYIRGYKAGQIYGVADGAYFTPVREDLDSMLSKIDPSLIRFATVLPGPYGLRYGPGFAFLDVQTINTPRYYNGYEHHNRAGLTYRGNGDQIYGRNTFYGGASDYGFIVNYGNRTGSDYDAGNGLDIPSSYHGQNFLGQIGFDLSSDSSVELRYQRLDQDDTEFAAQFFDVNSLVTDAFNLTYVRRDPMRCREFRSDMWFNRTRFEGDTDKAGKRLSTFPVLQRVDSALSTAFTPNNVRLDGVTDGDLSSTGARSVITMGDASWAQLSLGTDVRYVEQHLHEQFVFQGAPAPNDQPFDTNMPRAKMIDPGVFVEMTLPAHYYWSMKIGGRADWVHTTADPAEVRRNTSLAGGASNLSQNDILYAFYVSNDIDLSPNWEGRVAFGHAQRVPSLTQRYADGLFLGIIQNGFSRVIGDPGLHKERAWQADVRLEAQYESWRGRATAFHSWILDYATYQANVIPDPGGARLLISTNTDLATLTGFELYGETDVTDRLAAFGSMRYLDGRDREIDVPLPSIIPLESRVGLRLHDDTDAEDWGLEFGVRIVDDQDRIGALRTVGVNGLTTVETATPGFTTFYLRGFCNLTENLSVVSGVDNLFDRTYQEHLDLRLPAANGFSKTAVLSPGITPYLGIEWTR